MEKDIIRQFGELMEAFGLKMDRFSSEDCDVETFDLGIRNLLYEHYDYKTGVRKMEEHFEENVVYMVKDIFETRYVSLLLPEQFRKGSVKEFLHFGPYITGNPDEIVDWVMEKNQFPAYLKKELKEYYYGLPLVKSEDVLEAVILNQAGYIFGQEQVELRRLENVNISHFSMRDLAKETEPKLSVAMIEEKYKYEEQMMEAVRAGDLEKVIEAGKGFRTHPVPKRCEDNLRNGKNMMVIWNTLFRKAVQEAGVHPAHIDHISEMFAKRIEAAGHMSELQTLGHEMMRKYCLLVRNHSLRGYSAIVRDTLNYIDFHLKEKLSLKLLAEQVNANASYLSTQFRRETGKTVTDYINESRIHNSLIYLATTDMPIQTVAETVGIDDENYYARLFKKYQNQTAKQYRELMQSRK